MGSVNLQNLHNSLVQSAKRFHLAEADLLEHIQKADEAQLYLHYGCSSMHKYLVDQIGLSDANAYAFYTVARKAKEVPELKKALMEDNIGVSKLRRIAPVINKQNKDEWLKNVKTMSKNELEKEVAQEKPDLKPKESIRRVSKSLTRVATDVDDQMVEKWKKIQDMVSSRLGRTVSLAEAQEYIADDYISRNDSQIKAKKAEERKKIKIAEEQKLETKTSITKPGYQQKRNVLKSGAGLGPGQKTMNRNSRNLRIQVKAETKHALNLKTGGKCTFIGENGKRCDCTRHLHIHHIKPVSLGGGNELSNLTLLCSRHHKLVHDRDGLTRGFVVNKLTT